MEGIFQNQAEMDAHARQTVNANPRLATAAGDIRFKDLNGDNVINADDRTTIGNPWPDYEGGVIEYAVFKDVDLSAFVQFSQGNKIFNGIRTYMDRYGSDGDNHTTRAMDRWRPDHTNTNEPRAIWGDPNAQHARFQPVRGRRFLRGVSRTWCSVSGCRSRSRRRPARATSACTSRARTF